MGPDAPSRIAAAERRRRAHLWLILVFAAAVAAGCALRAFPPGTSAFYPACPFHHWTGLLCPGCGATRALAALSHGHLAEALRWNALVIAALPVGAGWLAAAYRRAVLHRERVWPEAPRFALVAAVASAAAFAIVRNLG